MSDEQETDIWWGAYCGWTMWPSFLACLLLTAFIGWLAWHFVEKEHLQFAFLGVVTVLWLAQFVSWSGRVFGYNYRLTTRRLFRDLGYRRKHRLQVDLKSIAHVQVRRSIIEKLVNVGRVIIRQADPKHPAIVLQGVSQPFTVAHAIREAVDKARNALDRTPP